MAERDFYNQRRDRWGYGRDEDRYDRDRNDRNFFERAADEVKDWFRGDENEERYGRGSDWSGRNRDFRGDQYRSGGGYSGYGGYSGGGYGGGLRGGYRGNFDRDHSMTGGEYNRDRDFQGSRGQSSYYGQGGSSFFGNDFGREGYGGGSSMGRDWSGRGRGGFSGRGPKSFQRSDDRIMEDICRALEDHDGVDASNIDIKVNNREVTLSGTVDDRGERRLAEECAERVWGVTDVKNEIRVQRQGDNQGMGLNETRGTESTKHNKHRAA